MENKKCYKFPSIEQFRHAIQNVTYKARFRGYDEQDEPIFEDCELPTLTYRGTVKLHGTNAGVVYIFNQLTHEYEVQAQSRENVITPVKDNAGFASFVHGVDTEALLGQIMKKVGNIGYTPEVIRVYGEWCGGNIQKGVALNGLDKMFVVVAIKIDEEWLGHDKLKGIKSKEEKIYNILDYPVWDFEIDFNKPKEAAERIARVVDLVEKECPVGKAFGNDGIGEGIVLTCLNEGYTGSRFWFKAKGEEHAKGGKKGGKKNKVAVDIERVNTIKALVETIVPESRLVQGLDYLRQNDLELSKKSTGPYLKWLYEDTIKEELDTISGNGFEPKDVSTEIQKYGRDWFFKKTDELVGL
jgi:hypothetical protein